MENKSYITVTLILLVTFFLAAGIRANGRSNRIPDITGEYYRQIENEYLADVRQILTKNGFSNAGLSLTKQVNEEGGLDYTLSVHHRRIDKMDETKRAKLTDMITENDIVIDGRKTSMAVRYIEY
jgi:hypothetical protein